MKTRILTLFFILTLVGCVQLTTGEKITKLRPGMSVEETTTILGGPDSLSTRGEYTIHTYSNRMVSTTSLDKSEFNLLFKSGGLIEYGRGNVVEKKVQGKKRLVLEKNN